MSTAFRRVVPGTWSMILVVGLVVSGCAPTQPQQPSSIDESPVDLHEDRVVIVQGGIDGPATQGDWAAAVAEHHVHCGLEDVESEDIDDELNSNIPAGGWERPQIPSDNRCGDDYETLLFRLTNCERRARQLPELDCDERLVWTARTHSDDMHRRKYFDHETPEGQRPGDRLHDRGVQWRASAENIAVAPTMALAHSGWMQSEGHRRNILREHVDHIGIGVVKGDRGYVMTTLFVRYE